MKKTVLGIVILAGLLLLVSCGPEVTSGPAPVTGSATTATPITVPTCTPTIIATPVPTAVPTAIPKTTNTPLPSPTAVATTVTPTETPVPTNTPVPTAVPSVAPTEQPQTSPTPAPADVSGPTAAPEPVATPEPTQAPEPSPTPVPAEMPSATPTPAMEPDLLVYHGWQRAESILGDYSIFFPEIFKKCITEKTDRVLRLSYQCEENREIEFRISYHIGQSLEETVTEILETGGMLLDDFAEEKKAVCLWQKEGILYRGLYTEAEYPQTLLGTSFGEQESVTGVMQVIFSYPAEHREQYEAAEYIYYVLENREE